MKTKKMLCEKVLSFILPILLLLLITTPALGQDSSNANGTDIFNEVENNEDYWKTASDGNGTQYPTENENTTEAPEESFTENDYIDSKIEGEQPEEKEHTQSLLMFISFNNPVDDINELQNKIDLAAEGDIIILGTDLDGTELPAPLQINKSLTFQAESGDITLYSNPENRHMEVYGGEITLTFNDVILDGNGDYYTPTKSGGIVTTAEHLTLINVVIQNCHAPSASAIHAYALFEDAPIALTLTGSNTLIHNNYTDTSNGMGPIVLTGGEGTISVNNGVLTMEDGVIRGNRARIGAGVLLKNNSEFYFNGGTIGEAGYYGGNQADIYGGGIAILDSSSAVIDGGSVLGNTIYEGSTHQYDGGCGIFVHNGSFLNLINGTISGNRGNSYGGSDFGSYGGGVLVGETPSTAGDGTVLPSTFEMNGGIIENNSSGSGGGVAVMGNSIFILNEGTIKNNSIHQLNGGGGGVFAGFPFLDEGVFFTMNGGHIIDNELRHHASSTSSGGGGVAIDSSIDRFGNLLADVTFTMNSGTISDNRALSENGGGIRVAYENSYLIIGTENSSDAQPIISNNNAGMGKGGGISNEGGHIVIHNGTISNSNSYGGGGGIHMNHEATLLMNGGTITGNNASRDGGGVLLDGNSIFTMNNGEISNSDGSAGVYLRNEANLVMNYGAITDNIYTGVCLYGNSAFTMDNGVISNNTYGGVSLYDNSTFTMNNGAISNNFNTNSGGGVNINSESRFTMTGGIIGKTSTEKGNSTSGYGGGVFMNGTATFNMEGGKITGNETGVPYLDYKGDLVRNEGYGGGLYIGQMYSSGQPGGTFTMTGGEITDNKSTYGGGISTNAVMDKKFYKYTARINNGIIADNYAEYGGGAYIGMTDVLEISDSVIRDNEAVQDGGGIYLKTGDEHSSWLKMNEKNYIIGNIAGNKGGGIFTDNVVDYENLQNSDYQNMALADETIFRGNVANGIYEPAPEAFNYINIGFAATSGDLILANPHPINNFDINFDGPSPYNILVITYHANGGTGEIYDPKVPYDSGDEVTVLANTYTDSSSTGIQRNNYAFLAWNTKADGSGDSYAPGDTFPIFSNTQLYAIWEKVTAPVLPDRYSVVYDGNGGQSSGNAKQYSINVEVDTPHIVLNNTDTNLQFKQTNYTFKGWSTAANGTVNVAVGSTVSGVKDEVIILYAVWEKDGGTGPGTGGGGSNKLEETNIANISPEIPSEFNIEEHSAYLVGYPDGTMGPEQAITRAETAMIFYQLLQEQDRIQFYSERNEFFDVPSGEWFHVAISTLNNAGILSGYPEGTFLPDAPISRAEFASIVVIFSGGQINAASSFPDTSGHWAEASISHAVSLGWISGYPDGSYLPEANMSRAEVASIVNRMLIRHPETKEDLLEGMNVWPDAPEGIWYYLDIQEASNSHHCERKDNVMFEYWISLD